MKTALCTALLLALVGCKKDAPATDTATTTTDPVDCSTITDTVPAFCGEVPKNLIFLSIDTFRRDLMERYGGDADWTPTLNRLANEGVVLDDNVQCSNWTFASTTCTLMGQTPLSAGFDVKLSAADPVNEEFRFLPGYLADAGYWSVLVSSNGWLSNTWGNGRDYSKVVFPGGGTVTGVTQNGINALREAQELGIADKWFLHLHGLEPHAPYVPPDEYLADLADLEPIPWDLTAQDTHYGAASQWPAMDEAERALLEAHLTVRYRGEARYLDDGIDQALARLENDGLLKDTLVVIWTDHGEQFWEHGKHTHAHSLYGEENDTVAIFWARNIVADAWQEPTLSTDLTPTVLGLLDQPIPPQLDGIPLGQGTPDRVRFTEVDARDGIVQAVLDDGWKLQFFWRAGTLILTHPEVDPAETALEHGPNADKVHALWALLDPKVQEMAALKGYDPPAPTLP